MESNANVSTVPASELSERRPASKQSRVEPWRPASLKRVAPGPKGLPLIGGVAPLVSSNRLNSMLELREQHGDLVRMRFLNRVFHVLFHPDLVQGVLADQNKSFNKQSRGYNVLRMFLGNGLLTSDGSFWLRQRRIAQPAFHKQRIANFARVMNEVADDSCYSLEQQLSKGSQIDLYQEFMRLTQRIAGIAFLSTDPEADAARVSHSLDVVIHRANEILMRPFAPPKWVPTSANRKFNQAGAELDALIYRILKERRAGDVKDDLLQMLVEAVDEETGEKMNDLQLRDEMMVMFLAGHETTASALTFSLYLLAKHPEIQEQCADEAKTLPQGNIEPSDVTRLDLITRAFKESMRLYPPAWIFGRASAEELSMDGNFVPVGSQILLSPWVTHRHPEFWQDPERFDPERFSPEKTKAMHRYQYFPFSGGPRLCIGLAFAMMEGPLVLAKLLQRYRFELIAGESFEPEPVITLRPKNGLKLKVSKR